MADKLRANASSLCGQLLPTPVHKQGPSPMKIFETRLYNISDFLEWRSRGQLELSPDFQRRSVWSTPAKSYLIDTIINGKPIPKILITQEIRDRRNIRIVVDGQQRLRAVLDFVDGNFKISRAHSKEYAGRIFDELPEELQVDFFKYVIGVDILYDMPYSDILDIFARLNTYTVKLSKQEILNARYVGFFKQLSYSLGYAYVDYFLSTKILTKAQVTRMSEAELASDLLAALVEGVQTNKNIESLYKRYEQQFEQIDLFEDRFHRTMQVIAALYPAEELATTNWRRVHLFYTLFTVVAHSESPLSGLDPDVRPPINRNNLGKVRVVLDDISARFDPLMQEDFDAQEMSREISRLVERAKSGATTDTASRVERANLLSKLICYWLQ